MEAFWIYRDLQNRTQGQLLLGVVGPVRTGKSTFIRRFMELTALEYLEDAQKNEIMDQLPVSGSGKLITTVEPKFIPRDPVTLSLSEDVRVKLRLIDCVGFLVPDAVGSTENDRERLVKTPWSEVEMPFSKAADFGTQKVIRDHATIGVLVTTDGSFGEIPRENYEESELRTVRELEAQGKPYVVVLNTKKPYKDETKALAASLQEQYGVSVIPVNCDQMRKEDIVRILEAVLMEFPVMEIAYYIPKWAEILPMSHPLKEELLDIARTISSRIQDIKDVNPEDLAVDKPCVKYCATEQMDFATGVVKVRLDLKEEYYYQVLTELTGTSIEGEYDLVKILKNLTSKKSEYDRVLQAIDSVRSCGYGVVLPDRSEMQLDTPVLIRQGNKFGVRLKAVSPTVHMIRADIETEIAPIVGSEEQASDLISYIDERSDKDDGMMEINIFGKSIEQLVEEGIHAKIANLSGESQAKLQNSMKKIVNDSNGGMICIII